MTRHEREPVPDMGSRLASWGKGPGDGTAVRAAVLATDSCPVSFARRVPARP